MSKSRFNKAIIYFLIILLISSSVLPGIANKASAATPEMFLDPLLEEWLPQPGGTPSPSQNFLGLQNQGANQGEPEIPSLIGNQSSQLPVDNPSQASPVELPKGELVLQRDDFVLPSYGFPITAQRLFKTSQKDKLSPFGYGWSFPYEHSIQMLADFKVAEFLSDGTQVNYTFHKDDESLLVDEFDGDTAIFYPLNQGNYTTDGDAKSSLARVSKNEYRVTQPHGMTYIFKGYHAPWRETADPAAGKLIAVENKKGDRMTLSYDSQGRLTEVKIQDGRTVTFSYNGDLISSMTDSIGRVTSYSYENKELHKVKYPDGTTETFTYDSDHRIQSMSHSTSGTKIFAYSGDKITSVHHEGAPLTSYVYEEGKVTEKDALGKATIYTYNGDFNVTKKVDALGNTYSYEYDSKKRLTKVINAKETITIQYDANDNVTLEKSSLGVESRIVYHPEHKLPITITDGEGRVWKHAYDANGHLLSSEYPLGEKEEFVTDPRGLVLQSKGIDGKVTKFTYDSYGQLHTVTDPLNQTTTYSYDKAGRLLSVNQPNNTTTTYSYDKGNRITSITDPKGQAIKYDYDSKGRLLSTRLPNDATYSFGYNSKGQIISKEEPNGAVTSYSYIGRGQLEKVQGPGGATVTFTYDDLGRLVSQAGQMVDDETYEYDLLNRPVKTVTPYGIWTYQYNAKGETEKVFLNGELYTTYSYDENGFANAVTNADGKTFTMTNDQMGRLLTSKDPKGAITTYEYNGFGNVTKSTDPLGRVTQLTYDDLQQVVKITDPAGDETHYSYNSVGQQVKMVDPLGQETKYEYDVIGQVVKEIDSNGQAMKYSYNDLGLMTSITNPRNASYKFSYDSMGQMKKMINPLNHESMFDYDSLGRLTKYVNEEGKATTYQYDLAKRSVTVTMSNEAAYTYLYTDKQQLQKVIDPKGHTTEYSYDSLGQMKAVKDAAGYTTNYVYDKLQHLKEEINPKGQKIQYSYDALDQLVSVIDRDGATSQFEYNQAGELTAEINALQKRTEYTYTPTGLLQTSKNPLGELTSYQYDNLQRLTQVTDPIGNVTKVSYDKLGNILEMHDQEGYKTSMSYDAVGNMTSYTDQKEQKWEYAYDLNNQLSEIIDPLKNSTSFTYTKLGNTETVKDKRGFVTSMAYNSMGNVTKVTDSLGSSISYGYDLIGNLTKIGNQENHVTDYEYDSLHRLVKETDPKGFETTYSYDGLGYMTNKKNAEGNITTYGYDAVGNMTSIKDSLGNETTHLYDQLGQLTKTVDANGNPTEWQYDSVGQLIKEINALGETHSYSYDKVGNLSKEVDPKGQTISYTYNKRQELTGVNLGNEQKSYEYDGLGNMTKAASPATTEIFTYDALSQVKSITNTKLGKTTQFLYDIEGNRTQIKDPEDRIISYTYNERNEMSSLTDPDGNVTSFAYKPDGQLSEVNRSNGVKTSYSYDKNDQVTSLEHMGDGDRVNVSFDYTYDKLGNRLTQVEEDGAKTAFEYDELSRLTKATYPKEKIESIRNTSYTPPNDKKGNIDSGIIEEELTKKENKKVIESTVVEVSSLGKPDDMAIGKPNASETEKGKPIQTDLEKQQGNPTDSTKDKETGKPSDKPDKGNGNGKGPKKDEDLNAEEPITLSEVPDYFKDPIGEVTYNYDKVGNRIIQNEDGKETKYVYNEVNELVQEGTDQFYYDENGNLVQKETKEGLVNYEYTTDNLLKGVYYADGSQVEFTYDALGRKASREQSYYDVSQPGKGKGKGNGNGNGQENALNRGNGKKIGLQKKVGAALSTETTQYMYDGMNVFKEYGENGQPLAQYYMGADQVVARKMFGYHGRKQEGYEGNIRTRGGLLYYHEDALGNIMDVSDRIGEQITKYRYDAFGNLFTHMAAPYNAVGFTGKSYDAKASLIDFSARWYSPNEGRFITEDTFGGWSDVPASLNRFSYAHNNPTTLTDPSGHCIIDVSTQECGDVGGDTGGGDTGGGSDPGDPGDTGGGSGGNEPPPPPTFEEILSIRTGNYNQLAGNMPNYYGGYGSTNESLQNNYVFGNSGSSNFGFNIKSSFGFLSKIKIKKGKLSSTGFMRQAGSVGLDFIPVVGNVKSGIEAIMGKDLITGKKLSMTERLIAGVGIFTGGAGKAALKGINSGVSLALSSSKATKGVKGTGKIDKTYSRPSGYRKGVRDEAWEKAKGAKGEVRDSGTGKVMNKEKPWDMGHKPGYEFRKHQQSAQKRGISRKEFLDEHNNPDHYRPELPSSNRSHKGEDLTDNYFGD